MNKTTTISLAASIALGIAGPILNRDWMVESFWLDPASMTVFCVMLALFGFFLGMFVMGVRDARKKAAEASGGRRVRSFTLEQKAMLQRLRKEGEIVNPPPGDRAVLEQLVSKGWAESEGYPNTGTTVWRIRR